MLRKADFEPADWDTQAFILASHFPIGRVWEKKFDPNSILGLVIRGLAYEWFLIESFFRNVIDELEINTTLQLLSDWETSVGLPDNTMPLGTTLQQRREYVIARLTNFGGIQTAAQYEAAAAVLGYTVTVTPGYTGGDPKINANSITITVVTGEAGVSFPLPFPLPFSTGSEDVLRAFFEAICPATDNIIIVV
jgi:hypothetical protein